MTSAFTLRSVSGLPTESYSITNSTLIIIHAQYEYSTGLLPLPDVDSATANIARILEAARSASTPVVHIAHLGSTDEAFDPKAGGRILDKVAPVDNESVIHKTLPNAFAGTDLVGRLRELGNSQLIITGFMTHMCVSATARNAIDLGFDSTVVSDATATRALPSATGQGDLSAMQVHNAALSGLAD
ncbi:MAG: cysteine hydrolase family protein, partial [Acidimicrobiales bacterium]